MLSWRKKLLQVGIVTKSEVIHFPEGENNGPLWFCPAHQG